MRPQTCRPGSTLPTMRQPGAGTFRFAVGQPLLEKGNLLIIRKTSIKPVLEGAQESHPSPRQVAAGAGGGPNWLMPRFLER